MNQRTEHQEMYVRPPIANSIHQALIYEAFLRGEQSPCVVAGVERHAADVKNLGMRAFHNLSYGSVDSNSGGVLLVGSCRCLQ
jgi:hypothetical protein